MSKHQYKIDIPVLLIFFSRDEQFKQVFEQVKKARPSKLYLYQDGPRDNRPDDIIGINKCRKIAEDIDWECEVHKYYQNKNFGCDPSGYIAHKWMFENEEMGIVLEDDVVPSQSFFPFCKELLEKYKDDERINIICGMNNTGVSKHISADYLFTKKGSIWGWASWKRVIDTWDETYSWLDNEKSVQLIRNQFYSEEEFKCYIKTSKSHRNSGRAHFESILAASLYLNSRINIVPKYNMISNIGIASESTHSVDNINKLPKRVQKLFFMKTYKFDFPLKHPVNIIRDYKFEKLMTPTKIQRYYDRVEGIIRKIRYGGFKEIYNSFNRKIMRYRKC
ncbi:hypothetical protein [Romboutsia timonensis]|uniref:hypothetical protein n=1 Tax=Romboutsia timonensis TaxID=1776391 RepID=UPI0008DA4CBA|nr:hypothetical protein [Romboutsia timonensis]